MATAMAMSSSSCCLNLGLPLSSSPSRGDRFIISPCLHSYGSNSVFSPSSRRRPRICCTSRQLHQRPSDVVGPVIIVPGWFSDSSQYEAMSSYLRSKGLQTLIVPLKWYNWIPSLGGRSVRPILDRIDATIGLALKIDEEIESLDKDVSCQFGEKTYQYTVWDFVKEFLNPRNGAQPPLQIRKEIIPPEKSLNKVTLVAHSAGGWICRILLGRKVSYDGKIYGASENVRALITLGTPHVCTDKLTKRNMDFVNENYPGTAEGDQGVDYICISGKFSRGESRLGGLLKDFVWQSYELCCGRGDVWGDGVIPIDCAIALEGAHSTILEGVEHFPAVPGQERRWYGSPEIVDKWLPLLLKSSSEYTGKNSI